MYAFMKGLIDEITDDTVVIDNNGIGYNIRCSSRTVDLLRQQCLHETGEREEVKLYTYTCVREDAFLLYGFMSKKELELFKYLITVNGIGPKGGLAILSAMDVEMIFYAITNKDSKSLAKAPGIGNKTAEKIILELSSKLSKLQEFDNLTFNIGLENSQGSLSEVEKNITEALVALGYSERDARNAVSKTYSSGITEEAQLLKAALREIY